MSKTNKTNTDKALQAFMHQVFQAARNTGFSTTYLEKVFDGVLPVKKKSGKKKNNTKG